jgi:hypothetical protein
MKKNHAPQMKVMVFLPNPDTDQGVDEAYRHQSLSVLKHRAGKDQSMKKVHKRLPK